MKKRKEQSKKPILEHLPALITALAALVTAIATLIEKLGG